MKKIINIILAGAALITGAACDKIEEQPEENGDDRVRLTVEIDHEDGTKSTLSEAGAFAFSSGDQILVCQGSHNHYGTTDSESNTGIFLMDEGFHRVSDGLVGFPAHLVTAISLNDISFTLPASYTFSEVGSADANTCKAPVPMVGKYISTNKVTLKQAGSVVRFRLAVSQIGEGNVSFSFGSNVTGTSTIEDLDPGTSALTAPTSSTGASINISISAAEWTSISGEDFVYITLPVPAGTVINDSTNPVLVTYTNHSETKMTTIAPETGITLSRAQGLRASASFSTPTPEPVFRVGESSWVVIAPGNLMAKISDSYSGTSMAAVTEWKFGGYFEIIGDATTSGNYLFDRKDPGCAGKWVDLFCWQGASSSSSYRAHGLVSADYSVNFFGNGNPESTYNGCWNGLSISNGNTPTYNWRPMTSEEWQYLVFTRTGAEISGFTAGLESVYVNDARYSRATVAGVNGLLLFPDGLIWGDSGSTDARMNDIAKPNDINGSEAYVWGTCTYTASEMSIFAENGIVFLPVAGYRDDYRSHAGIIGATFRGDYWTNSSSGASEKGTYYMAQRLAFRNDTFAIEGISNRGYGFAVRLARDVAVPTP